MKSFKKPTICFALFERIDQWIIKDVVNALKKSGLFNIVCFEGLSYDSYVHNNKINVVNHPFTLSKNKIILNDFSGISEEVFLFLMNEKIHSLETKVLFKRINFERKRISKACKKCNFFVIPEDTDAVRGRLVAAVAGKYNLKTLVFLPLYYDWITIYPLCGKRIADDWITPGNNYPFRLTGQNVKIKNIHTAKINIEKKNRINKTMSRRISASKPYYLVALQNNDEQEEIINFVADAFKCLRNKKIIFKYHPSTSSQTKKYLKVKYSADNVVFVDKIDLVRAIKQSIGLITFSSTTILDAVCYGKPVIVINAGYFFHELYLLAQRTKAFEVIKSPKVLSELVESLDNKDFNRNYVNKQTVIARDYFCQNKNNNIKTTKYLLSRMLNEK